MQNIDIFRLSNPKHALVSSKIYDKQDDFGFEIVHFSIEMFLALLLMVYTFCSLFDLQEYVSDFNNRNQFWTAKFLNKVINFINFLKHFLNSTKDTQS